MAAKSGTLAQLSPLQVKDELIRYAPISEGALMEEMGLNVFTPARDQFRRGRLPGRDHRADLALRVVHPEMVGEVAATVQGSL